MLISPIKKASTLLLEEMTRENLRLYGTMEMFPEELQKASNLLKQAAELAEDPGLKKYLNLRAEALVTDEYYESDVAWMQMKNNGIDMVVGPIETYEDRLFGNKAAFESYVLVKDKEWSKAWQNTFHSSQCCKENCR